MDGHRSLNEGEGARLAWVPSRGPVAAPWRQVRRTRQTGHHQALEAPFPRRAAWARDVRSGSPPRRGRKASAGCLWRRGERNARPCGTAGADGSGESREINASPPEAEAPRAGRPKSPFRVRHRRRSRSPGLDLNARGGRVHRIARQRRIVAARLKPGALSPRDLDPARCCRETWTRRAVATRFERASCRDKRKRPPAGGEPVGAIERVRDEGGDRPCAGPNAWEENAPSVDFADARWRDQAPPNHSSWLEFNRF